MLKHHCLQWKDIYEKHQKQKIWTKKDGKDFFLKNCLAHWSPLKHLAGVKFISCESPKLPREI
jgi:hypothetical protein